MSYIRKHINTFYTLCNYKDEINEVNIYKKLIKRDLRNDLGKLIILKIDKKLKIELLLFLINYRLIKIFEILNTLRVSIKNKISESLFN